MNNNETLVQEWYTKNIEPAEIDKKVKATIDYLKRFDEPEDGDWVVWAHEVVSGRHGQYTVRVFLDELLNDGNEKYMTEHYNEGVLQQDTIMMYFDESSKLLASNFNRLTKLNGLFYVGHNEGDGSLGVFYTEKA